MSYIKRVATLGLALFVVIIAGGWAYTSYQFNRLAGDLVKIPESLPQQAKTLLSQIVDCKSVDVNPYFLRIDFKGLRIRLDWKTFREELFPLKTDSQDTNASTVEMLEKLGLGKEIEIIGNVRLQYNSITNRTEVLTSETLCMVKLSDGRVFELSDKGQGWKTEIHHGNRHALVKKSLKEALKAGALTGISCSIDNHTTFLKGSDVPLYKIEHAEMAIYFDAFTSPQRIHVSVSDRMKNADYSGFKQLPGTLWEQTALYGVSNSDFKVAIDINTHESITKILEKIKELSDLGDGKKKQLSDALVRGLKDIAVSYRTQGEDAVESKTGSVDIVLDMSKKFLKVTLDLNTKPLQNSGAIANARIKSYELAAETSQEHPTDKQLLRDIIKLFNEHLSQYHIRFDGSYNWQQEKPVLDKLDYELNFQPISTKASYTDPYLKGQLQLMAIALKAML